MSAPITEAHRKLVAAIIRDLSIDDGAQLIADSEARAVAEWQNSAHLKGEAIDSLLVECDRLRAEVEQWELAFQEQYARAESAERKAFDWKKIARYETARAERAEAILGELQELHGCSQEMVVHWCARAAERSLGLDQAQAELATERARLKEMAAELAHCAGYIASVRTDRLITWHEELYALQTVEWAEGAFEIAEKANAVLEAHDAAMKEGA